MSPRRERYTSGALFDGTERSGRRRLALASPAWIAVTAALGLSLLGLAAIGTTRPELAARQGIFLVIGISAAALATLASPRALRGLSWGTLVVALALLVFVLLPFVPKSIVRVRNGARAWIDLGFVDFQPSELAKIAFILCLAQWLALRGSPRSLRALAFPVGLFALLVGLIVLEPDLGSALLFGPTLLGMLVAAGARKRHLLGALLVAAIAAPAAYFAVLKPYQRARIDAIVAQIAGDERYERDIGFQGWRAMRLAGSGGVFGNDASHAKALIERNGLPEEHNDMVFAVVACRFGVVGGAAALVASLAIAASAALVAAIARDGFSKLVAVGIGTLLFAQMAVNVGMTIGLLPITGVTLPFVSYGGSSLVACWVLVGILVSIGIRPPSGGEKDPFHA